MSARRALSASLLLVVMVVTVVTIREVGIGCDEVMSADAASDQSKWPEAVDHARAAAEAFVPASPWPERGWIRLASIGHDAEARGDDDTAMLAYGAMRAAAIATRGPLSGWERRKTQADEGLDRVAASRRDPLGPHATADVMLAALRSEETPTTWLLVALAASAVAMLGGLARLAWLGEDARTARIAQLASGAGFITYVAVAWMT